METYKRETARKGISRVARTVIPAACCGLCDTTVALEYLTLTVKSVSEKLVTVHLCTTCFATSLDEILRGEIYHQWYGKK